MIRLRALLWHLRAGHRIGCVLLAAAIAAAGAPSEAHGPYSANVRHARAYAREHVNRGQWRWLDRLWDAESHWSVHARTPENAPLRRTACGIPQFFPCTKLIRAAGRDALNDGTEQIIVGLRYIRGRYGTPRHARLFQMRHGYY